MLEILISSINKWNTTKSERQKLQHTYLVLAVVIVLIAGVVSLFNATLGHNIVKLALLAIATFIVNAVGWSLLQSSLLDKLSTKSRRK